MALEFLQHAVKSQNRDNSDLPLAVVVGILFNALIVALDVLLKLRSFDHSA